MRAVRSVRPKKRPLGVERPSALCDFRPNSPSGGDGGGLAGVRSQWASIAELKSENALPHVRWRKPSASVVCAKCRSRGGRSSQTAFCVAIAGRRGAGRTNKSPRVGAGHARGGLAGGLAVSPGNRRYDMAAGEPMYGGRH